MAKPRLYVLLYDIESDRDRTRLAKYLLGYGDRIQYSAFLCWLTPGQFAKIRRRVTELMRGAEDRFHGIPVSNTHPIERIDGSLS
jgi:CRISPR-associated protein Cas2